MPRNDCRLLLIGDGEGIPQLLRHVPRESICGLVGASDRPDQWARLREVESRSGLELLVQPPAKSPEYPGFESRIRALRPSLIITHSYSMRLPRTLLDIPERGAVNIHFSLLPDYRGPNPIQWALLNDETETGVTLHYMEEAFDSGDIIAQRRIPIRFTDTWLDVIARCGETTDALLKEELPRILEGTPSRVQQDHAKARYPGRRRPEDGEIDWRRPVVDIYNLVRALVRPHPGAFYRSGERKVILDEYLSLAEVTALKYGLEGGQTLQERRIVLRPVPFHAGVHEGEEGSNVLTFSVHLLESGRSIGVCRIRAIDHARSQARISLSLEADHAEASLSESEAARLALDFAHREIKLRNVEVEGIRAH